MMWIKSIAFSLFTLGACLGQMCTPLTPWAAFDAAGVNLDGTWDVQVDLPQSNASAGQFSLRVTDNRPVEMTGLGGTITIALDGQRHSISAANGSVSHYVASGTIERQASAFRMTILTNISDAVDNVTSNMTFSGIIVGSDRIEGMMSEEQASGTFTMTRQ